jgi:hypothetical protein
MKNLLLFTLFIGLTTSINAQNKLVVFNQEGKQFYIILNGIKQNAEAKTNVKVEQLTGDSYKLKVIFADGSTPDVDKAIYFGEPNHEYVTELKKNNKGIYKIRMINYGPTATNSYQAANTVNYTNTNANSNNNNVVTNNGNNNVTTHQTTTTVTTNTNVNGNNNGNNENINMDVNIGGVGMNLNVNVDENLNNGSNTSYTETHTTTTTTTTNGNNYNNNHNNGCFTSNVDLNSIISAVKAESFADDKKIVAKQALNNKCISSDQTVTLLGEFSFDDDKLEIAKHCYDNCSDKENFYKVNSAFSFSDSKEALNKYIESK